MNAPPLPAVSDWARALWQAERTRTAIGPPSRAEPPLAAADAYAVQLAVAELRRAEGHLVVGKKIGLTSAAMQTMIGVTEPDFGHLFDVMQVPDGGTVNRADLILPRVEPELAFVLGRDLPGSGTTQQDVLAATAYIVPAIEIVDSRVRDWAIRWADTVADNGSSCRFVLGHRPVPLAGVAVADVEVSLRRNGVEEAHGAMTAVLGSPLNAICWLAEKLAAAGIALRAGEIVLPGSPCKALDAHAGDIFDADFGAFGGVQVRIA